MFGQIPESCLEHFCQGLKFNKTTSKCVPQCPKCPRTNLQMFPKRLAINLFLSVRHMLESCFGHFWPSGLCGEGSTRLSTDLVSWFSAWQRGRGKESQSYGGVTLQTLWMLGLTGGGCSALLGVVDCDTVLGASIG